MDLNRLYRASDALYKHRAALQDHLFSQAQSIFGFGETGRGQQPNGNARAAAWARGDQPSQHNRPPRCSAGVSTAAAAGQGRLAGPG